MPLPLACGAGCADLAVRIVALEAHVDGLEPFPVPPSANETAAKLG